jgi:hypothetical protein
MSMFNMDRRRPRRHRREAPNPAPAEVRKRLDAIYSAKKEEDAIDPVIERMQALSLPRQD